MNRKYSIATLLLAGLAALPACNNDSARLRGHFIGLVNEPVYLERVIPGLTSIVDTAVTDAKGEFGFKVALVGGQPTIFNLRHGSEMVPLLISPGERVNVMSFGNLERGYRVSGSAESELVAEVHDILTGGAARLDSISGLFAMSSPDGPERRELAQAYVTEYHRVKREQIRFIVENSSSLAAVYALYQRLPGDDVLFNGDTDYVYYRMVADSVERHYPESRYLIALEKEVATRTANHDWQKTLAGGAIEQLDFPDIELPNMYGQKVKLSSLTGKVIILDFWSATSAESRINNAELKELYAEYADRGLAIYQVSLDTSKPLWVNAVQEQKLPWTTVCDFRGMATMGARLYNITSLPADFVLDRSGNIAGKNLYGDQLAAKIKELI